MITDCQGNKLDSTEAVVGEAPSGLPPGRCSENGRSPRTQGRSGTRAGPYDACAREEIDGGGKTHAKNLQHSLNIGAHVSLAGKPRATVMKIAEQGYRSMQIFASSPGAWRPPSPDLKVAEDFRSIRQECGIDPLVIHAIYLINLASADPNLVARSKASLTATLEAGEVLGAAAVITHIGSHAGRGFEAVAAQVAEGIVEVAESAAGEVQLALENSAGAGGIIGSTIEELGVLLDLAARHPRLKITLDTAHLCGAGWDFGQKGEAERLVSEVERHVGLDRLLVLHANDSLVPCGSRKDRHAIVGEGHIGLAGFRNLLQRPELRTVPWILETPDLGRDDPDERVQSLHQLRPLVHETFCGETIHAS